MEYTLADIAQHIGATVNGDDSITVSSLATLAAAETGQISFLANSKYKQQLAQTRASAVIISDDSLSDCPTNALVMKNPYLGYAKVAQMLDTTPLPAKNIHAQAIISPSAFIGENVSIGANAVIEDDVVVESGACIGAGCFIGIGAKIGANTKLWANVSVYHSVIIGANCLIQSNTVIGSDGFGYANEQGQWIKIPQIGTVIVGDNVEIGASTTIDRGALDNTIIGKGVILDNQIQIAHNVVIGEYTAIAGCSVIAGSTIIGKNCTIAGMVAINGHISIADGTYFTGMTMVTKSIDKPGVYSSGIPAQSNREWSKMNAYLRKLGSMTKRISVLEKLLAANRKEN